ncbi:MAG: carboxypeptidase regulatory-like domain-containing protein [Planctomycetes bacterium]|nr:carboxypeptidase regulatory-like domain-containing protein [Planctomycetota bacterium]
MRRIVIFIAAFAALGAGAWIAYRELIAPRLTGGPEGRRRPAAPTAWRQVPTEETKGAQDPAVSPLPPLPEEDAPDAIVLGRVLDANLAPISGVEGEALPPGRAAVRFRTDEAGSFRIPAVPGDEETLLVLRPDGLPEPSPHVIRPRRTRAVRINWVVGLDGAGAILPESLFSQESGDELRIAIRGATDLPDDAVLIAGLAYGEKTHFRQEIRCSGGRLDGEIVPDDRGYFSGAYRLEITYDPHLQSQGIFDGLPANRRAIEIVEIPVYVGDPESAARYDEELVRYYGEAIREIWPLVSALEIAADLAVGAIEDPAEREDKHLRLRARTGVDPLPGGRLDTKVWRAWIDEKVRPAIDAMEERHRTRAKAKYPEVENRLGLLYQDCRLLSRIASVRAYRASGRVEDPADAYFSEIEPAGEQILTVRRMRKTREFVDRWIRERRAASTPPRG